MAPKLKTPSTPPGPLPNQQLGTVLVTGGCGFLGFYIVGHLLGNPNCGPVCIIDRDVSRNAHDSPKAEYIACNITDADKVGKILDRVRPEVIFHTASPNATYGKRCDFYPSNVTGTETLLRLAKERSFVKALVYTSSNSVYAVKTHNKVRESAPTWCGRPAPWKCVLEYAWTKGTAHNLVLDANESWREGGLKTCCVVPANIYGVRDGQTLSLMFDLFKDTSRPVFQVGKGRNMASFVEAGNCADLHVLAAMALLEGRDGVGGEAFNAADGEDLLLWWHTAITCAHIRNPDCDCPAKPKVRVIPAWIMCVAVYVIWWVMRIFTLGFKEPPTALTPEGYAWCTQEQTLDIRKARRVLGFAPKSGAGWHEDVVKDAVDWERERRRRAELKDEQDSESGKQKAS